uniref:Uncharacterized protein n=1 Tax=uncultured Bacteroidota bacterium TaxID=152509 RepID=H5SB07_9BACT|nr:hypothetical protein HGMM_F06F04C24 [uncultured Bacteroidetes bacterium]
MWGIFGGNASSVCKERPEYCQPLQSAAVQFALEGKMRKKMQFDCVDKRNGLASSRNPDCEAAGGVGMLTYAEEAVRNGIGAAEIIEEPTIELVLDK